MRSAIWRGSVVLALVAGGWLAFSVQPSRAEHGQKKLVPPPVHHMPIAKGKHLPALVVKKTHKGQANQGNQVNGQEGDQGNQQNGQAGEQGEKQNGQVGDQGEKQNGQAGDQGEKQNGQAGDQGEKHAALKGTHLQTVKTQHPHNLGKGAHQLPRHVNLAMLKK
jgi:hypothetical protein